MKATEVTAGLAESNGSLLPGLWRDSLHVTSWLTACTPGSAPGPTLGNEYGKTLPFLPSGESYGGNRRPGLLPGLWRESLHVTCGLTACTPGSAPGPALGNEYGKTLPFYCTGDSTGGRCRESVGYGRRRLHNAPRHSALCRSRASQQHHLDELVAGSETTSAPHQQLPRLPPTGRSRVT